MAQMFLPECTPQLLCHAGRRDRCSLSGNAVEEHEIQLRMTRRLPLSMRVRVLAVPCGLLEYGADDEADERGQREGQADGAGNKDDGHHAIRNNAT